MAKCSALDPWWKRIVSVRSILSPNTFYCFLSEAHPTRLQSFQEGPFHHTMERDRYISALQWTRQNCRNGNPILALTAWRFLAGSRGQEEAGVCTSAIGMAIFWNC